jgi:spore maturation protein SpmB
MLAASPAAVNVLREALRQMVGLAGSWIKAGVLAVCGLPSSAGTTSSSGRHSMGGAGGVSSGGASRAGVDSQEAQLLLQVRCCVSTSSVSYAWEPPC